MRVGTVPYVSNLTANKYGLSAWFSDAMPADHIADSLGGILNLQTSPGRTANPDVLDVQSPGPSGCRPPLIMNQAGTGCITADQAAAVGYKPPSPDDCTFGDIPCYLGKLFKCDDIDPGSIGCLTQHFLIRAGLVIAAVLIIAAVVISFR